MYNKEEKALIAQAFCWRFDTTETECKNVLDQCNWNPFLANQIMMSHKTKSEQPSKTIAEIQEDLRKLKREPSSKEYSEQLLKRCRAIDRQRGIHNEDDMHSMVNVLKLALNQFPNSPKKQLKMLKHAEQGFPKPTPSPSKIFQKNLLKRIAHIQHNRKGN